MYEGSLKIPIKTEIINLPKYNIILSVRHLSLSLGELQNSNTPSYAEGNKKIN